MSYKVIPSETFEKDVKKLNKKYKKIKSDLQSFLKELQKNPTMGTPLGNNCYKVRVANSSIPTGKSGGFRIITLIKVEKEKIFLLTIYSKSDKENITDNELRDILSSIQKSF